MSLNLQFQQIEAVVMVDSGRKSNVNIISAIASLYLKLM